MIYIKKKNNKSCKYKINRIIDHNPSGVLVTMLVLVLNWGQDLKLKTMDQGNINCRVANASAPINLLIWFYL